PVTVAVPGVNTNAKVEVADGVPLRGRSVGVGYGVCVCVPVGAGGEYIAVSVPKYDATIVPMPAVNAAFTSLVGTPCPPHALSTTASSKTMLRCLCKYGITTSAINLTQKIEPKIRVHS